MALSPTLVTRTTSLFNDGDADLKISPNDTLITHIIIKNTAVTPITSVSVTDTLNSNTTYVSGTIFVTVSDTYSQTGNTPKDYSAAQGLLANDFRGDSVGTLVVGTVNGSAAGGGAVNVYDSANNALLAGTVSVAADGSFTYTPAAGYTGTAQFTYTTSDGSHNVGTATASIVVSGLVWYVDGTSGSDTTGDGTYAHPYLTLGKVSTVDHVNDSIVVHGTVTGGITLKGGETLYGDGSTFSVNGHQITNAGTDSVINHSAVGITLASGNTIDGVDLVGTATGAVGLQDGGATVGTLTINRMAISGQGQIADIDQGGTLAVTLKSAASTGFGTAATGGVLDLEGLSGSFTVTGQTTISGAQASGGITVTGSLAAAFQDATSVNTSTSGTAGVTLGGTSTTSFTSASAAGLAITSGAGIGLTTSGGTLSIGGAAASSISTTTGQIVSMTNTSIGSGGITFGSLSASGVVTTGNAINLSNVDNGGGNFSGGTVSIAGTGGATADGIHIDGGSSANFSFGTTTIGGASAVTGDGIEVNGTGNGTVTFSSVAINNTALDGVKLLNSGNTVTISAGTIGNTNDPGGIDLDISGGTGAASIAASLTKTTAGHVVDISGHSSGQIDVTGAISATGAVNNGISLTDNTGGNINFTNSSVTLTTGANTALNFTNAVGNATGAAVNFSGGNLAINTTTGTGINAVASNAGAATTPIGSLTISGSNNTVTQTGAGGNAATAINVNGVAEAITLKSVNVGASGQSGNNAISLQNAGATSASNFFQIQGTGGAGTGGTINHTTVGAADASTTQGSGIYLNNVGNISLASINVTGSYDNLGLYGKSVNNFTLTGSTFSGSFGNVTGATNPEGDIRFGDTGTDGSGNGLTGTASFQGNNFSGAYANTVAIYNEYKVGAASNSLVLNVGTVSANTFGTMLNPGLQTNANDALYVEARGNGTTQGQGFNLTTNVSNNNFNFANGDLFQVASLGNSATTINLTNNQFINQQTNALSGGGGVTLSQGGQGSVVTYTVSGNTFKNATGMELVVSDKSVAGTSSGVIINNTFGDPTTGGYQENFANPNHYGVGGVGGIMINNERNGVPGAGTQTNAVRIENNKIADYSGNSAIIVYSNNTGGTVGSETTEITFKTNTTQDPNATNGFTSLELHAGDSGTAGDNGKLGLYMSGNTFNNGGAASGDNALDFLGAGQVYFPGYTGGKDGVALTNYLQTVSANVPVVNTLTNGGAPNTPAPSKVDFTGYTGTVITSGLTLTVPLELAAQQGTDWESQLVVPQPDLGSKGVSDPTVTTASEQGGGAAGSGASNPTPAPAPSPVVASLDQATLDQLVAAAIHRWELAGASADEIAAMKAVTVTVADMAGSQIGSSVPGAIQIDRDAGGYSWFVDQTPDDDSEFSGTGSSLTAPAGSAAAGHVDLLTVLEHELGHQIGLEDDYQPADSADVMYGYLNLGERRLATADDVKAATGTPVHGTAFDLAPTAVTSIPGGGQADVSFQSTVNAFSPGLAPTITGTATVTYSSTTLTASESINTTNDTMTDSAGTVTTQALAVASLTLGNLVFKDNDKSGTFNAGDVGVGGVTVQLYLDNGTTAGFWDASDTLIATTTTSSVLATLGQYQFTGLAPGDYIVVIPSTMFGTGQPLAGLVPHTGATDPDDNVDNDNNGIGQTGGAVASQAITLDLNTEPSAGAGNDTNNTLDLGFQANTPPTATTDTPTVTEDSSSNAIDVLANDSDADGDTFTVTAVGSASHGSVSVGANGANVVYTPTGDYNGPDSFTYTVTDSHGASSVGTVNVTVTAVNDPVGTSGPGAATFNEDTPATIKSAGGNVALSIHDVDAALAPAGVYEVTLSATHGTLTLTTTTGLNFTAGDGSADTTMTFHGTLSDINTALATATYSPDANYHGSATIQIDAYDTYGGNVATGTGASTHDGQAVNVTVNSVNDAPTGTDENGDATEGTPYTFSAADFSAGFSDPIDGNAFAGILVTSLPTTGTLSYNGTPVVGGSLPLTVSAADLTAGKLTFDAASGSGGTDSTFAFKVQDDGGTANGGQNTAASANTFTLHVAPASQAPVAVGEALPDTAEDTAAVYNVSQLLAGDSDPDAGDTFTVSWVGNAVHGTVTLDLVNGKVTFTPDPDYNGPASFDYKIKDNHGVESSAATETLNVTAVNDAPTAAIAHSGGYSDGFAATEQVAVNLKNSLTVGDVDAASGTITVTLTATYGLLTVTAGGSGAAVSGSGTGSVTITGTLAQVQALLGSDATSVVSYVANTDTPPATATLTLGVNDGGNSGAGGAKTASDVATIHITAVDDAAVAKDDNVTTPENVVLNGDLFANNGNGADSDPDGPAMSITEVNGSAANVGTTITLASGAKLTVNANGTFTYDPNHAWDFQVSSATAAATGATDDGGTETFTYKLANGNTATVIVSVTGVDGPGDQLRGNSGDNTITGTSGNDFFNVSQGGNDTLSGGGGNDAFYFGAALTAADQVDGGSGQDVVAIQGDYSAGLVLGAGNLVNVETLSILTHTDNRFGGGSPGLFGYNITTVDANVASGKQLIVNASTLQAGETFTFNGSAETDGSFFIYAGAGTDVLTGGAGADVFFFAQGMFNAGDRVIGGAGNDIMVLRGDYSGASKLAFAANAISGVETLTLMSAADTRFFSGGARYSYDITMNDGNVASGATFTANAGGLRSDETLTFNGSAETNGNFRIFGGAGNDTITGGQGNDLISGGLGSDTLDGGAGNDTFVYKSAAESSSTHFDTILNFDQAHDHIDLPGTVVGWGSAAQGTLSDATFDSDLASALQGHLGANKAVLFTANAGTYSGQTFLIVDADGDGVYQADHDYVIHLVTPTTPVSTADTHIFV